MKVNQMMTRGAVCCPATGTLAQTAWEMWDKDVGFVPIVAPDSGALVGVVTDRDICMAAMTTGRPLHEIPISEVMQTNVYACADSDHVARVHSIMRDRKLHRVPVIDGENKVVGIVAINDLARQANTTGSRGMRDAFITTMSAICEPRLLKPVGERVEPELAVVTV